MKNRARPWATATVAALALGATCWHRSVALLALDRVRVLHGEAWRLWTCHLVHFGPSHLAWNLTVFVSAGAWAECVAPRRTRIFYVLAPLGISLALLLFVPTLAVYAGLSGVAAGVLALLGGVQLAAADRTDRWFWCAVLGSIAVKLTVETITGGPIFAQFDANGIRTVPLAHLAGALIAVAILASPPRVRARPRS